VLDDSLCDLLFGDDPQFDSRNEVAGSSWASSIVVDSCIVVDRSTAVDNSIVSDSSNTGGVHSTGGCKDNTESSIGRVHTDSNMPKYAILREELSLHLLLKHG